MRLVWRGATTNGTLGVGPCEKPPAGTAHLENPGALPLSPCGSKSRIFNPCWLSASFARCDMQAINMTLTNGRLSSQSGPVYGGRKGVEYGLVWSLRQKLDSPRQADRRLGQSNAQKRLFDRP